MTRLKLPLHTRIITNSRASMYELINDTPAYYFDAMIPSFISEQEKGAVHNNTYVPHRRTLLLEGCSIRTEYGWLMRKGRTRTDIEEECIDPCCTMVKNINGVVSSLVKNISSQHRMAGDIFMFFKQQRRIFYLNIWMIPL